MHYLKHFLASLPVMVLARADAIPLKKDICDLFKHPLWSCNLETIICKANWPSQTGRYDPPEGPWRRATPDGDDDNNNNRTSSRLDRFLPRAEVEASEEQKHVYFDGFNYFYTRLSNAGYGLPKEAYNEIDNDCCMPTWECFDFFTKVKTVSVEKDSVGGRERFISKVIDDLEDWKKAACCMQNWFDQKWDDCVHVDRTFPIAWFEPRSWSGPQRCSPWAEKP